MSIAPIGASPIMPVSGIAAPTPAGATEAPGALGAFGDLLEGVSNSIAEAERLGAQLATGELTDIHQLTAAAAKAELGTQLTVAFRDRAVEAFQQIMQMPI